MDKTHMEQCLAEYGLTLGSTATAEKPTTGEKTITQPNKSSSISKSISESQQKSWWKHRKYWEQCCNQNSRKADRNFLSWTQREAFINTPKQLFQKTNIWTDMLSTNKTKYGKKIYSGNQSKKFVTRRENDCFWRRNLKPKGFCKHDRKKRRSKKGSNIHQEVWLNREAASSITSPNFSYKKKNSFYRVYRNHEASYRAVDDVNNNLSTGSTLYKMNDLKVGKADKKSDTSTVLSECVIPQKERTECVVNTPQDKEDDKETIVFDEAEFSSRNNDVMDLESYLNEISESDGSNTTKNQSVVEKTQNVPKAKKTVATPTQTEEKDSTKPSPEESGSLLEDDLAEVSRLVKNLHEANRIIVQLIRDTPTNTELASHFKTVIKSQQDNFRKDIWKNQKAIMKGYDKMVSDCKDSSRVAAEISKRTCLNVEDVHNVISRCIFVESTCDRQTVVSDVEDTTHNLNASLQGNQHSTNEDRVDETRHETVETSLVGSEPMYEQVYTCRPREEISIAAVPRQDPNIAVRNVNQRTLVELLERPFQPSFGREVQYPPNVSLPPRDLSFCYPAARPLLPQFNKNAEEMHRYSPAFHESFPFTNQTHQPFTQVPSVGVYPPQPPWSYPNSQPPYIYSGNKTPYPATFPSRPTINSSTVQKQPSTVPTNNMLPLKNLPASGQPYTTRTFDSFPEQIGVPSCFPVIPNQQQVKAIDTQPPDPTIPQKLTMKNHRLEAGAVLEADSKESVDSEDDELEVLEEFIVTKPRVGKEELEVLSQRSREYICARSHCKKPGEQICDGCRSVIYCSDACQLNHWIRKHMRECQKLKELRV